MLSEEKYSDTPTEARSIRAYILGNAIQHLVYRKVDYSKKFYNERGSEIIIRKAAKKAFDDLGLRKLPTVKQKGILISPTDLSRRYYFNKQLKDIAAQMGISYAYVRVLHNRALQNLRIFFENQ